jgi:hypothetical protein
MSEQTAPHLDENTYRLLRSGKLDPAHARRLAEHLDGPCETCEAFLAAQVPDDLDGSVDTVLTQLAPASPSEAGGDLEFSRIQKAVRGRRPLARATRWVAAAAAVLLVGGVSLTLLRHRAGREDAELTGIKGRPAQVIPARLRFAVVDTGRGAPELDRGRSGAVVPAGASLAFRVELGRPAYVALLRIGGSEREVIWKQHVARPGAVDISENGRPAAYPLQGLAGTQRFALVASERPIAEDDLAAAAHVATGASAGSDDPRWSLMTLDVVEVTIR